MAQEQLSTRPCRALMKTGEDGVRLEADEEEQREIARKKRQEELAKREKLWQKEFAQIEQHEEELEKRRVEDPVAWARTEDKLRRTLLTKKCVLRYYCEAWTTRREEAKTNGTLLKIPADEKYLDELLLSKTLDVLHLHRKCAKRQKDLENLGAGSRPYLDTDDNVEIGALFTEISSILLFMASKVHQISLEEGAPIREMFEMVYDNDTIYFIARDQFRAMNCAL